MKLKKWLISLVAMLSIPMALADLAQTFHSVFDKIVVIGNLGFLGLPNDFVLLGVTRLLIWILSFTIFFGVITSVGKSGKALGFLNKQQGMVVALIVATIAAIFMPAELLLATGTGWATMVALVIIGGPVVGIAFLLWKIPWDGNETRGTLFLKLVICFILFWILSVMRHHVGIIA